MGRRNFFYFLQEIYKKNEKLVGIPLQRNLSMRQHGTYTKVSYTLKRAIPFGPLFPLNLYNKERDHKG